MKKSKKLTGGIYAFLEASGIMEKGTEAEIAEAKKQYWAMKKRQWKNLQRKEHKGFEILFTPHENKLIQLNAKKVGISATKYIKQAALSTKCITPLELRGQVRQYLRLHYNAVDLQLQDSLVAGGLRHQVLEGLDQLERDILKILNNDS